MADRDLNIRLTSDASSMVEAAKAAAKAFRDAQAAADKLHNSASRAFSGGGANGAATNGNGAGANGATNGHAAAVNGHKQAADKIVAQEKKKADDLAAIMDKWVAKDYQAQVKREQQAIRSAERAANAQVKEEERRQQQVAKAAERAASMQVREEERRQQQVVKAAERANAQQVREEERKAKYLEQLHAQAGRAALRENVRRHDEAKRASEAATAQSERFASSLLNIGSAAVGIGGVVGIINEVKGAFDAANRSSQAAASMVTSYRESLRELAALKGGLGNTGAEVASQMRFRMQTLQSPQDAAAFQGEFLNQSQSSVAAGIMSQAEADKLMVRAGAFQATEGGDAGTHARLAGMLPRLMGKKGVTAAEAAGAQQTMFKTLQLGGASFSGGVGQILQNASAVTSGTMSLPELTALTSAFTMDEPAAAGTRVGEFTRATVGSLGQMRGTQFAAQGPDDELRKRGEYMESIGAKPGMSPAAIGRLIAADMAKEKAKRGNAFSPDMYLGQQGFGNLEDKKAIKMFAGTLGSGQFEQFEKAANAAPDVAGANRAIAKFQATDPVALSRKAELAGQVTEAGIGGGPMEQYQAARKIAFAQLREAGSLTGKMEDYEGSWSPSGWRADSLMKSQMVANMEAERKRVGLKPIDRAKQFGEYFGMGGTDYDKAQVFSSRQQEIVAAGGNALPGMEGLSASIDRLDKSLGRLGVAFDRAGGGAMPVPALVAPGQPGR